MEGGERREGDDVLKAVLKTWVLRACLNDGTEPYKHNVDDRTAYHFPGAHRPVLSTGHLSAAGHHGLGFQEVLAVHGVQHPLLPGHCAHTQHSALPHPVRPTGGAAVLPASHPPPGRNTQGSGSDTSAHVIQAGPGRKWRRVICVEGVRPAGQ